MQTLQDRAKVKSFYYSKIAEGMSVENANKLIEYRVGHSDWEGFQPLGLCKLPTWVAGAYRIKPETVTHKGGEYPKPINDVQVIIKAQVVYYPDWQVRMGELAIGAENVPAYARSYGRTIGMSKSGMYHLTEAAALDHAQVLFGSGK